jgi:cytochrome c oxidase assembly protein subunit 15
MVWMHRFYRNRLLLYRFTGAIFFLVIAQVLSGGLLVLSHYNLYAGIFHTFFVTLMFGFVCYSVLYVFRRYA